MDLNLALEHNRLKLLMDIVEHLTVYLQRFKDLLVRVLEGETGEIRRDLAPAGICTSPVRRSKEDNEPCPFANYL